MYNFTLSLTSVLDLGGWSTACLRPLYSYEKACIHCTGGQVGNRDGLDGCGKSRPTGIRSSNRPASSDHM